MNFPPKMQPGYLLPPKKFSFRGKTNIRVVFFLGGGWGSGFSKDSVYAIALIGVWAKFWLFRDFLPIFPSCQLSSFRTSGFVGSHLGKTLAFSRFFTQFSSLPAQLFPKFRLRWLKLGKKLAFSQFFAHFSSLPAQFFQEFGLRWLAFGQNTGFFTVFYPIYLLASSALP